MTMVALVQKIQLLDEKVGCLLNENNWMKGDPFVELVVKTDQMVNSTNSSSLDSKLYETCHWFITRGSNFYDTETFE